MKVLNREKSLKDCANEGW